jgi:hypothetical protein
VWLKMGLEADKRDSGFTQAQKKKKKVWPDSGAEFVQGARYVIKKTLPTNTLNKSAFTSFEHQNVSETKKSNHILLSC